MDQTTFADMLDTNIFSVSVGIKKELLRNLSVHCQIGYYSPGQQHDTISVNFDQDWSGPVVGIALNFRF